MKIYNSKTNTWSDYIAGGLIKGKQFNPNDKSVLLSQTNARLDEIIRKQKQNTKT